MSGEGSPSRIALVIEPAAELSCTSFGCGLSRSEGTSASVARMTPKTFVFIVSDQAPKSMPPNIWPSSE